MAVGRESMRSVVVVVAVASVAFMVHSGAAVSER
jgi:hypothetical protein